MCSNSITALQIDKYEKDLSNSSTDRKVWIDWLRVISIFFVLIIHSTEPFYLGGEGGLVLTKYNALWVSLFDSLARACVPLFVIASSYLQFPLHYSTGKFFRRRLTKVIVPFLIWTAVYAFVWGEPGENFANLLLNFNYSAGHLWFVYMLVGIYLLIPLLSPWAEKVSKKELSFYLAVCFITSFFPFIREWFGGEEVSVIYGPSGIPNIIKYPLWGESSWNSYGIFYYFCGFIGYMLFGLYVRRFCGDFSWRKTVFIGIIPLLIGFGIAFSGFYLRVYTSSQGVFPVETPLSVAALWETPLFYDSTGVALMAIGWIFIFKKLNASGFLYSRLALPLSKVSYGVYLVHMLILVPVSGWFVSYFGSTEEGAFGAFTLPGVILGSALFTFVFSSMICFFLSKIPYIGKYIV